LNFETSLADGTPIYFRPIEPDDKQRLVDGFASLSPESRYRRFFTSIDHLSEKQLRYLTEIDYEDHFAWVALLRDEPGRPAVGVARWIRLVDEPEVAEAAVTVGDEYQNRGIGKTLLVLLARSATEKGVKALRAVMLPDNLPMLKTLEEFGAEPGRIVEGIREVTIPLPGDIDELDGTPAPLILREVAAGEFEARAQGEAAVRLEKRRD
jgi:RimJ/RimL family protein N-acetyltransferase